MGKWRLSMPDAWALAVLNGMAGQPRGSGDLQLDIQPVLVRRCHDFGRVSAS